MAHPYVSFDPHATITGETLQAVFAAFQSPQQAHQLFRQHSLPTLPQPWQTYPLQFWLNLLADVEQSYGPQTVYSIGLHIVHCSKWPAGITTLDEALHAMDRACRANVQGSDIGHYSYEPAGPQQARLACLTPTPPDFEYGLLTGVARKFKPPGSLVTRVEKEPLPDGSPLLLKRFRVQW